MHGCVLHVFKFLGTDIVINLSLLVGRSLTVTLESVSTKHYKIPYCLE